MLTALTTQSQQPAGREKLGLDKLLKDTPTLEYGGAGGGGGAEPINFPVDKLTVNVWANAALDPTYATHVVLFLLTFHSSFI